MRETCFTKKRVSCMMFAVAVFFTGLFAFLSTVPSNVNGKARIYLYIGLVVFCLIWYTLGLMFGLWYIHLETDKIVYRNYFGKKKTLNLNEMKCLERKPNGTLSISDHDKTIIFEPEYADIIMLWVSSKGIKINTTKNNDAFIIRPARYQRVLSIFCLVMSFSFFVLELATKYIIGCEVFGVLVVFGIWNCCCHYSEKYVVGNGCIEKTGMFNRKKIILYTEISKADIEHGDNVSYILFFTKQSNKPLLKINLYYENAFLLRKFAYKKKWLKNL
jgi:hypothetical protein